MKTLVVLQPSYLPWLGYFSQMQECDVFVFYDDVQFDKHGWRNRNRVKTHTGSSWLTVPVLHNGRFGQRNNEVEIATNIPWARRHMQTIEQAYSRSCHMRDYLPALSKLLNREWRSLSDLNIALIRLMCSWFGLERDMRLSSELNVTGDRNTRLIALCQLFGVDRYFSGNAAKAYLNVKMFADQGISVEFQTFRHPEYSQLHGAFVPHLSALDLILNLGDGCREILQSTRKVAAGQ
jgi:WbqC-like protein family